jgi:hypothetical protein
MRDLTHAVPDAGVLPPGPPSDAVDLATLLSTTVRVEPELLRAVRVVLLPQADVGAESDLWFSQWAASRNPRAMVLLPDVQRVLRTRLPEVLARCASPPGVAPADRLRHLIASRHHHLSPLMRLEEEILWLSARGGDEDSGLREAEAALRSALRALVEHAGREAIADWVVSVCPRLPEPLRHTVTGWQYRSIAYLLEPNTPVDRRAPARLTCQDAALVVDSVAASGETDVPETWVAVRLDGDVLHVGGAEEDEPGSVFIGAPGTDPVVLEVLSGMDDQTGRPLQVRPGERVRITGCSPTTRLLTADRRVYDPSTPVERQPGGVAAPGTPPRSVLLGPPPVMDAFSRSVHDDLREGLRRAGHEVWDLQALWPSPTRTGDIPWPLTVDVVVFLLDRELLTSPVVRDQIRTLTSWAAEIGAPKPLAVPLGGLRSEDRRALPGADACTWVDGTYSRVWSKDCPWGPGHAWEIAAEVADAVGRTVTERALAPVGTRAFPTRHRLLSRRVDELLRRFAAHGERRFLDEAIGLFPAGSQTPPPTDVWAAHAHVGQARALHHRARLTGSPQDAESAVRLLRRVMDRTTDPSAAEPGSWARLRRRALTELLSALRVHIGITGAGPLPDRLVAALDEAVTLGRAALDEEQEAGLRLELAACLAPLMASDLWLRRHPLETRSTALLNFAAAGAGDAVPLTERVAAARDAARLATHEADVGLAVRVFDRWFALLEGADWVRLGATRFAALTAGFAGAPENAAVCAVAAGEPAMAALLSLERGLALQRVILAGRAVHGDDPRSCQPRWRRSRRLRQEVARLAVQWTQDELRAVTSEGPVVVLATAEARGEALILSGGTVTAVRLPGVTAAAVRRWSPDDPGIREALRPVAQELRRRSPVTDGSRTPRMFWCPTGSFSRLPVHEACSRATSSPTVSTYTASLSELCGSRRVDSGPGARPGARPLVVVSPAAGDAGWAERAAAEVRAVTDTGMAFDLLTGAHATRLAVLEAATGVEVVHLVGRLVPPAVAGWGEGWAIALADGPLTAADIAAADLSRTGLVFLSGYGEAVGGGTDPDRDTLAGSLHRAGCRHVVASLSTPGAPDAADGVDRVVARFYEALLDGGRRPRPDRAPFALHQAMTAARGEGETRRPPQSFVHIGS